MAQTIDDSLREYCIMRENFILLISDPAPYDKNFRIDKTILPKY